MTVIKYSEKLLLLLKSVFRNIPPLYLEAEHLLFTIFYWCGDIEDCDRCEMSFVPLRFMVDARLRTGSAGNVCALCFLREGRGIGEGCGQIYEVSDEGWLLVAG